MKANQKVQNKKGNDNKNNKGLKTYLPFLGAAIIIILIIFVTIFAIKPGESEESSKDFAIQNGVLIKYNGDSKKVTIPNTVTIIEKGSFDGCTSMKSLVIPNTVTTIEEGAFSNCTNLKKVTIPKSVTTIEDSAFANCTSLKSIKIPDSVIEIGGNVFLNTPWIKEQQKENQLVVVNHILIDGKTCEGEATIPDTVTKIAAFAFSSSKITSIVIPDSVTEIGDYAFKSCSELTTITIPNNLNRIGKYAFENTAWLKAKQIEDPMVIVNNILIDGRNCTKEVIVPSNVTSIEDCAFERSRIVAITIPESVTRIGDYVFSGCTDLTDITIPETVTNIGFGSFDATPWMVSKRQENQLVIVNNILLDGQSCQGDIVIPDSVVEIVNYAFRGCIYLRSLTIPNSVTRIGEKALGDIWSSNLTLIGSEGSFAQEYADHFNIPFTIK